MLDACVGGAIVGLALISRYELSYPTLWNSARSLAPVALVVGAVAVVWRDRRERDPAAVVAPALVLLVAAFMSLTQFPFAAPIYFLYIAPLVLLAAIAAMRFTGATKGLLPPVVLAAFVLFAARAIDHQSFWSLGVNYRPDPDRIVLDTARADVRARRGDHDVYWRLLDLIRQHRSGNFMFAGPDAPEVYFLSGLAKSDPGDPRFLGYIGFVIRLEPDLVPSCATSDHRCYQSRPSAVAPNGPTHRESPSAALSRKRAGRTFRGQVDSGRFASSRHELISRLQQPSLRLEGSPSALASSHDRSCHAARHAVGAVKLTSLRMPDAVCHTSSRRPMRSFRMPPRTAL